ncbi:helix-turn-helix transcriptional regulator [Burkholderia sp. Ac-20353]|uniref:AraC family transcriptional regulator n=1 Tax=Burkholderia sp. Ac-20353 TaxID=2703894 RepID=UPI00197C688D|nr:helix-turn-helix transcriptional regulator [Burkholderia sp. Ac-20353]MBN3789426.1 AraC family transcriptional regulator [Burkholderia sp. Ac-20353]
MSNLPRVVGADPSSLADVDHVPRPLVLFGGSIVEPEWQFEPHSHRKAQLLYTLSGVIYCEIDGGVWSAPPQCMVWIPGDVLHSARGSAGASFYCVLVDPDAALDLPARCCTLGVSPLLRELLLKAAGFPNLYDVGGPQGRLMATLLDELVSAPVEDLYLPMPADRRLRKLVDHLLADPADKSPLGELARQAGISERSLTRLAAKELGMSLGDWRRRLHVALSLQMLTAGRRVHEVAIDLGYESASSFVTMFRKATGKSPMRYLTDRRR